MEKDGRSLVRVRQPGFPHDTPLRPYLSTCLTSAGPTDLQLKFDDEEEEEQEKTDEDAVVKMQDHWIWCGGGGGAVGVALRIWEEAWNVRVSMSV